MNPAIEALQRVFEPRQAALQHTIAWVFADGGAYLMQPRAPQLFQPGFRVDCDLIILTNTRSVTALLAGELDPHEPQPGQLFVWGGLHEALRALQSSLGERSPLAIRAASGVAK